MVRTADEHKGRQAYLKSWPSMRMTPSKCNETEVIGRASPGPGRKCRRRLAARGGDLYAGSSALTSTVTSTRNDSVVYQNKNSIHTTANHSTGINCIPESQSYFRLKPTPQTHSLHVHPKKLSCARGARAQQKANIMRNTELEARGWQENALGRKTFSVVKVLRSCQTHALSVSTRRGCSA